MDMSCCPGFQIGFWDIFFDHCPLDVIIAQGQYGGGHNVPSGGEGEPIGLLLSREISPVRCIHEQLQRSVGSSFENPVESFGLLLTVFNSHSKRMNVLPSELTSEGGGGAIKGVRPLIRKNLF